MCDRIGIVGQDPQTCAAGAESGGPDDGRGLRDQTSVELQPQEANITSELDLHFKQNAALPIHSLPPEIVLQVIHHHMRPYLKDSGSDYYQRLIRLSGVCSYWCNVIRDSPSLWNRIHWSDSSEVIGIAWQRSSSHSLHVVLHATTNVHRKQENLPSFVTAVDVHRDRWRSMDVSVPASWMGEVVTALREPALGLEKLSLTDEDTILSTTEIDLLGGTAPRLNDLTLNGVSIRWDSEVLYELTVLDLSWICFPSTNTILDVLSHSPRLQTAAINHCTIEARTNPTSPSIQLPHLLALQLGLGSLSAIEDLLGHIEAPGRCSLATSLMEDEEIEGFLQRRLLKGMSKWRDPTLIPFEGLLLEIDGGVLRLELSTADFSEPLTLTIHGFGASWVDQFRVALPRLIEALASWIKDTTTLRLRLGYPPSNCHALPFKQFIIEQVSRLPPVTSLEVSGVDVDSLLHGLRLGDVSSLFKNIRTLSFSSIAFYALRLQMDWLRETVQIVKDAAKSSSDEPNHGGQVLNLELHVPVRLISQRSELMKAAVKDLERLVGSGKVLVVGDG